MSKVDLKSAVCLQNYLLVEFGRTSSPVNGTFDFCTFALEHLEMCVVALVEQVEA